MSIRVAAAMAAAMAAAGTAWASIGLTTQFSNIVMENLAPGRSYNLRELKGLPYTVRNRGDGPVEVVVDVTVPTGKELYAQYEPLPDGTWLEVNPAKYRLGPGEAGFSDVIVHVPNDPKYLGRHFQGMVWAHTVGTGLLAAGVTSSVRFSVGKGPESLEAEAREKAMVDLNYDLWPNALYVNEAKAGPYDVKKAEKKSFKLTNRSEKDLELVMKAVPWQGSASTLPPGYEKADDVSWAKFEPETVKIEGESLKDVKLMLDVPEKLKGKKLAFLVQLSLPIGTIVNISNRVYVVVQP